MVRIFNLTLKILVSWFLTQCCSVELSVMMKYSKSSLSNTVPLATCGY